MRSLTVATSLLVASLLVVFSISRSVHSEESVDGESAEETIQAEEGDGSPTVGADYRQNSSAASHKIAHVTVYSDRAEITRSAQVSLKNGSQWVHFSSLPANLDRKSVRVQAPGLSGRIRQVVLEDAFEHSARPADLEKKLTDLRQWYGELAGLNQDEQAVAEYLSFVQNLRYDAPFKRDVASQAYRSFSAKVDSLKSSMDEIHQQSGKLSTRLYSVREKIRDLQERIDHVTSEIQNVTQTNDQKWMVHVYAQVDSAKPSTIPFEVNYQIPNAKWRPLYDVRSELDRNTGTANIRLVTTALVEQHTGEDWKGVKLTLSTLDPIPLYLPKFNRWVLSEVRREAPAQEAKKYAEKSQRNRGVHQNEIRAAESEDLDSASGAPAPASPPARSMNKPRAADGRAMMKSAPRPPKFYDSVGGTAIVRKGGKDEAAPADALAAGPRKSTDDARFSLEPLGEMFPELEQASEQLSSFKQTDGKWKRYEPTPSAEAPQPNTYDDSSLPAVQAAGHLIEFTSSFPIDLKNDEPALKTPVHAQLLKGDLSYFSVPKKDTRVFLRAKTTNTTEQPILGGAAQVFMDGDLVSKTSLSTLSPDSFFTLDLGTDRNVETKRIVKKQARKTGLISKTHITDVGVKIELANHHAFPVKMEIKDNYPLTPGEKIEVELEKVLPKPVDKKDGLITWEVIVPANQKTTLSFSYKVTHPENYLVSEFD